VMSSRSGHVVRCLGTQKPSGSASSGRKKPDVAALAASAQTAARTAERATGRKAAAATGPLRLRGVARAHPSALGRASLMVTVPSVWAALRGAVRSSERRQDWLRRQAPKPSDTQEICDHTQASEESTCPY
jgi:hypothetical protein